MWPRFVRSILPMSLTAPKLPLIVIIGSTGTGKSQLAVDLATRLDGEVVNADSLQLYQGLPITTNKITQKEKRGVPHHLLDCIKIEESAWTVGKFVHEARETISDIRRRQKLPILVGGTHYYTKSLLFEDNLIVQEDSSMHDSEANELDWPILGATAEQMMAKLVELDPIAASWWHPRDTRKIRRSLEICLETGRKVSDIYQEQRLAREAGGHNQLRYNVLCFCLHAERDKLIERLDKRVDKMLQGGLLDEIQFLRGEYQRLSSTGKKPDMTRGIWVAIGYKEFTDYLDKVKDHTAAEIVAEFGAKACEQTKISTRQYAARQARYIKQKLFPSFVQAGASDRCYLLDATFPNKWPDTVTGNALAVTKQFLVGEALPKALSMNAMAATFVSPTTTAMEKNVCEACGVTTTTKPDWEKHIRGTKHRRMLRRQSVSSRDKQKQHVLVVSREDNT